VIRKISKIVKNKKELLKYMEDISFLGGLFDVEIKAEPMPIQVDIRKTLFYKWGEQKCFEKGKKEGLKEGEKRGIVKGLKRGKQEGLKEGILGIIQVKFGSSKAKLIKGLLDKINDINRLKKIKKEVIRAEKWDDIFSKYSETTETIGKIEFELMSIQIDIRKTIFYKWGEREGEKRGILKGLKEGLKEGVIGIVRAKFGGQKAKQFKNFLEKV
jgi:predicted transposase YdaD